jgi:hypothetical protein
MFYAFHERDFLLNGIPVFSHNVYVAGKRVYFLNTKDSNTKRPPDNH